MKKAYVIPTAEKLEFQYEKVVVASSGGCFTDWVNAYSGCQDIEHVRNMDN